MAHRMSRSSSTNSTVGCGCVKMASPLEITQLICEFRLRHFFAVVYFLMSYNIIQTSERAETRGLRKSVALLFGVQFQASELGDRRPKLAF